METFTLLIWEEVPENSTLFLLPNSELTEEELNTLEKVNGKYCNSVGCSEEETTELLKLNAARVNKEKYLDEDHPAGSFWAMRYLKYKIEPSRINCHVTNVVKCGFIL